MQSQVLIERCICLLYMLTAGVSIRRWRNAQLLRSRLDSDEWFWLLLASFLVVFGINKIADLQTLVLFSLKSWALALNLDHAKLTLKMAFAGAILGGSVSVAGWLIWRFRDLLRRNPLTLLGLACLASYYLIRAADFLGFALPVSLAAATWIVEVTGLVILQAVVVRLPQKPVEFSS